MFVAPIIANRNSMNTNSKSKSNNQLAFKAKPLTVDEFRKIGNALYSKVESIGQGISHSHEETKVIDDLKELLLNSKDLKLTEKSDKILLAHFERKLRNLEPENTTPPYSFFFLG